MDWGGHGLVAPPLGTPLPMCVVNDFCFRPPTPNRNISGLQPILFNFLKNLASK